MSKESYKSFGRGTPAGNAVYNLYNGKKTMDSTLDPDLLARLQKMRKEKDEAEKNTVKPKVVPKSQAHVNVPKPSNGRKPPSAEQVAEWRLQALGRRKRMDDILVDTQSSSAAVSAPHYSKPARTDADKTKLQQIMEHGEELPPMKVMPKVLVNRLGGVGAQRSRRDVLSEEFDRIAASIAERRRELKAVQERQAAVVVGKATAAAGGTTTGNVSNNAIASLRAEETQLLIEIGRLVSDMKQVDRDISELPEDED
eukprot:GILI01017102.1.p1 GENE.GILI01017102.1~~GILI01017102.1.p1  ORF type:complete len:255 (+),score=55.93 GILI01017102.1:78-842(+)